MGQNWGERGQVPTRKSLTLQWVVSVLLLAVQIYFATKG